MKNLMKLALLCGFAMMSTGCGTGFGSYGYHSYEYSNLTGTRQASAWYDKQNVTTIDSEKKGKTHMVSQTHTVGGSCETSTQTPATYNYYTGQTYNGNYVPPAGYTYNYSPPANYSQYNLGINWNDRYRPTTQPMGGYASTRPYQ